MPTFQDIQEIFMRDRVARLMRIAENEQTRFQFEVWFEYTRQTMMDLREGTLLAVRNFATRETETHYSILEVVSIMPVHYALGESLNGYPGFVMEAARNIATDWVSQENRSQEDTTVIRCIAVPTGLELVESSDGRDLAQEQGIPMIGSDVRVFNRAATELIVNHGIDSTRDHIFTGGNWLVDSQVPIYVRAEDLIRVHFGIFGFTGVGKSNLVSTYVANLLRTSQERQRPIKIVLFDLMSEYTVLLLDQLLALPRAWLLGIGEYTFPGRVVDFLSGNAAQRQNAVNDLAGSALYPRFLERIRDRFQPAFERLLNEHKIRIRRETMATFDDFLRRKVAILERGRELGGKINPCGDIIDRLDVLRTEGFNEQVLRQALKIIDTQPQASKDDVRKAILQFRRFLEEEQQQLQRQFPLNAIMGLNDLLKELNNRDVSCLFIIQSHDPDDLRDFAFELGRELYERRRRTGTITPPVSFIFDEADEFIPQHCERDSSYSRSAWIAETLARRGRKFGVGIGICTQRVANLRTSVMAQPHTYLISKLPRQYDRKAIQDAFGFSEDMFRQTFKFAPGDWLLVSHDATGLKGTPIPIHAEDANQRILAFLKTLNSRRGRLF